MKDRLFRLLRTLSVVLFVMNAFSEELKEPMSGTYSFLLATGVILLIHFGVCMLSKVRLCRLLFSVALLVLTLLVFPFQEIPKGLMVLSLLLFLTELSGLRGKDWGMFFAVLFLFVALLPAPKERFDWSFVVRIYRDMAAKAEYFLDRLEFSLLPDNVETGYSGLLELKSGMKETDRLELTARTAAPTSRIYLCGSLFERDPSGDIARVQEEDWLPGYLNTLWQQGVSAETAESFSKLKKTTLTYALLKTQDVLHPQDVFSIETAAPRKENDPYRFAEIRGEGTETVVLWADVDYGSETLQKILSDAQETDRWASYEELRDYCEAIFGQRAAEAFTEARYQAAMARRKPQVEGKAVSDREQALADKIAAGCSSEIEKIRAVEAYLRQYRYTLDAPVTDNPAEDFLFSTQEGWCVHFSMAASDLLKAMGIPARIRTGYIVRGSDGGTQEIRSDRAHAWVEAYVDGFGWIPVEGTPIIRTAREASWSAAPAETAEEPTVPVVTPEAAPEETQDLRGRTRMLTWFFLKIVLILLLPVQKLLRFVIRKCRPISKQTEWEIARIRTLLEKKPADRMLPLLEFAGGLPPEEQAEYRALSEDYYAIRYGGAKEDRTLLHRLDLFRRNLLKKAPTSVRIRHFFLD